MAPASSRERPAPPAPWRQRAPRRAVLGAAAALGVRGALGGEAPAWWRAGMPPHEMPQELQEAFTLGGRVPVAAMYVDDTNGGAGTHYSVDRPGIQRLVEQFGALRARGPGPRAHRWALLFEALAARPVEGWRAVVFGSTDASVEAILLAHGAAHVTTVEYNNLTYSHPQLAQAHPSDLPGLGKFDLAVSLSSFDHDGLGRYGDPVRPDADLAAMVLVRLVLAADELPQGRGVLLLSVPVGPDVVVWNLHRRYGPVRLPLLLDGWRVLERLGWEEGRLTAEASWRRSYEPLLVLRPLGGAAAGHAEL